ncbi:MAG TPA: hypothetical protein VFN73_03670 [Propionibacteriaceae bacterium]|nr:hypothetical protein [Propionibacteriaceae bacterium]
MAERDGRTRVLSTLRSQGRPLDVREVARLVGLHVNTVRFHLEGLVDDGDAQRTSVRNGGRGRPRTVYSAGLDPVASDRAHRMLAGILTDVVAGAMKPRRAGELEGRRLAAALSTDDPDDAFGAVAADLDTLGFVTEAPSERPGELLIHRCPFQDLARRNPEIVCDAHLGVLNGMLDAAGAQVRVSGLDPFVSTDTCRAFLVPLARQDAAVPAPPALQH